MHYGLLLGVLLGLATVAVDLRGAAPLVDPETRTPASPLVRADGNAFSVNGEPRFLVLVSYFDALDAAGLGEDLDYLAERVDGIRIFANWWDYVDEGDCRLRFSAGTLMEVRDGGAVGLRPSGLERLQQVLREAGRRGLVVDLTFAADPVEGLSKLEASEAGLVCPPPGFQNEVDWSGYARALADVTRALEGREYAHVWFDLQNEAGHDFNRASDDTLARLVKAVRAVDRTRLITVSRVDPDPGRHVEAARTLGLSFLTFHDFPRGAGWGGRTAGQVTRVAAALKEAGLSLPIYVGEPDSGAYGQGTGEFLDAARGAREAGAAGWTFHTQAGYRLDEARLADRLDAQGHKVLEQLGALPRAPGGRANRPADGVN